MTETTIDRELLARDLALLADLLAPAIEARLSFLGSIPVIGPRLLDRLQGSPRAMTYDALARVLELPDREIAVLVDAIGRELGAWRGALPPLEPDEAARIRPVWDHLVEEL